MNPLAPPDSFILSIPNLIYLAFVLWVLGRFVEVVWQCPKCGKVNTTNFFKSLFFMCDHEGGTQ